MSENILATALLEKGYLLADGATGTNLFAMGLQTGDAPELWNLEHPQRIKAHYQSFVDAGSDIILTNTFGGTHFRLALHNAEHQVAELNAAGVRIAREVAAATSGRTVIVAGSIGPTGELPEPMGSLTKAAAVAAFAEQAIALRDGGADVAWIETMSSLAEAEWAMEGASQAGLPMVCTFSFDTNGRSMMGVTPAAMVAACDQHSHQPYACGSNCGVGASELVLAVRNMRQAPGGDKAVIVAKANCGIPEYIDGAIHYNGTPELMAKYACMAVDAGADIVGGCCGTSPTHIAAMRQALDSHTKGLAPSLEQIVAALGEVSKGGAAQYKGDLSVAGGSANGATGKRRSRRR
ncbi:MAG: betaine--homocysteine S-methyltransferase [Gammaproteobacteria bacterium]|jgi:5-methyltetrahydrofolate--homocysteine methyltransferase|nr:betaine--homocysteine S-methyltransferase [Gammaproteobacteria bacterium]